MTPTSIVAYLTLFTLVGFGFLFVALLVGRLLRARVPTAAKLEAYECGEPPVGSSYVRFDLRFYVVALLFVIFDVEVAFFFPWATVFGKANELTNPDLPRAVVEAHYREFGVPESYLHAESEKYNPLKSGSPVGTTEGSVAIGGNSEAETAGEVVTGEEIVANARRLTLASMADLGVFFGVLLVGFAYIWKRGDLNWVRAVGPSASEIGS